MSEEFIKVIADSLFANTSMKELSAKRIYEIAKDMAPFVLKGAKMELMKCAKLSGWLARDEDGCLHIFEVEPRRSINGHQWWDRDYNSTTLDKREFPKLRWEDEPVYVKIIIIKED